MEGTISAFGNVRLVRFLLAKRVNVYIFSFTRERVFQAAIEERDHGAMVAKEQHEPR